MTEHYLTLPDLVQYVARSDTHELQTSLRRYLFDGRFGSKQVFSQSARHIVVSELHAGSDDLNKEKLETAFSFIIEGFEPSEPPTARDCEYVFNVLSLASTIRNVKAKERLRRWLYINAFEGWQHGPFSLHAQLILATAASDSDEQWLYWIKHVLPTRTSFSSCALEAYRALLQTGGLHCISLLPDILLLENASDTGFVLSFSYLLGLTIKRVGAKAFCNEVIALLNRMDRPIKEVFVITLRSRDIIARALESTPDLQKRIIERHRALWESTAKSWSKMSVTPAYETLDGTLEAIGSGRYRVLPSYFRGVDMLQVIEFDGGFSLPISKQHSALIPMCGRFFEIAALAAAR